MKECPLCKQVYADDTLNFCLSDGTGLARMPYVSDETIAIDRSAAAAEETLVLKPPYSTQPTEIKQTEQLVSNGVNPLFAYFLIGFLALLLGGGLIFWLMSGVQNLPANEPRPSNISNSQAPDLNTNLKAQQDALEQERQKLADERRRLDASKTQNPPSTERPPAALGGTWFIVLGSFPKAQSERANLRLKYVQGLGIEASIVDTDNYPGFRGSLYAVVVGPFSKNDARSRLASMKRAVPDAYAKSGY
ncbi:MAG: hypothetical protein ACKVRN_08990 [Pyrinomonadaceae bacterium]